MGFFNFSKKIARHLVDIRVDKWFGLNFVKRTANQVFGSAKNLVTPEQATRVETFEQALERLKLTEAYLKIREKNFTRLFLFFLALAAIIFAYSTFIATCGNLLGFWIGLALTFFTLSQAFRYHFWLFQIRHRKLGCTLKDWLHSDLDQKIRST